MRRALGLVVVCGAVAAVLASCVPRPSAGAVGVARVRKANKRCTECHLDFIDEALTLTHQEAGVACVRCHGDSQAHREDEVRATKADVTFRGSAMQVCCLTCHDPARHGALAAHATDAARQPSKRRACTQCHGEHKLLPVQG